MASSERETRQGTARLFGFQGAGVARDRIDDRVAPRVLSALGTVIDVLLLNAALLVSAALVVTLPMGIRAGFAAFERRRGHGEERLLHSFIAAWRSTPFGRTTLVVGTPLVAIAVGVEEVHYFAVGGGLMSRICFGLGLGGCGVVLCALAYVVLVSLREPELDSLTVWSLGVRLTMSNLLRTGPLTVIEAGALVYVALVDPALLLLGVPAGALYLMWRTATFGAPRDRP